MTAAGATSHRPITILGGLAFSSIGLETAIVSFAVLGMRDEWQLSPTGVAAIIAAPGLGQFAGSVWLGQLSDRLGRKGLYAASLAIMAVLTALAGLSPHPAMVCALLFLAGLGQGGATPVVTAMVTEAAPAASRGRQVGIIELMFACGWAVAALAGRGLAAGLSWRALVGIGLVPVVLAPLGLRLLRLERPNLASRPDLAAAAEAPDASQPSGFAVDAAAAGQPRDVAMAEWPQHGERRSGLAAVLWLWQPRQRAQTSMLWLLWVGLFGVWFGPVLWLPALLATMGDPDPAGKGSFVALAMLVGASLVLLVIDRASRPLLIAAGFAIMAAGCAALGAGVSGLQVMAAGMVLGLAGQAIWPVCLTYSAELYPAAMRGLGMGWALGAGRIASVIAPLALGVLLTAFSQPPALLAFAALSALTALVVGLSRPKVTIGPERRTRRPKGGRGEEL